MSKLMVFEIVNAAGSAAIFKEHIYAYQRYLF